MTKESDAWRKNAACRDKDPDIFFDIDKRTRFLNVFIQRICNACDVNSECLDYALKRDEKYGAWGGTTPYQREQIKRHKTRVKCPGCGSQEILQIDDNETCISCALSWNV